MALRGDLLVIKAAVEGSSTAPAIIAESTDCTFTTNAEALETTSQTSGLNATFISGKVTATASGSFLVSTGAANLTKLFAYQNAGTLLEIVIEVSGTPIFDGSGVLTSLEASGGLSDALVTGSYSIQCSGDMSA